MEKRYVFLILASGALGTAIGSQYPTANVRAAIVDESGYKFSGVAGESVITLWKQNDCVVGQAVNHANNNLELIGDDILDASDLGCPIHDFRYSCRENISGIGVYNWEYKTRKLPRTIVYGSPQ